jgi:DNA polymerase III delta prime subunit
MTINNGYVFMEKYRPKIFDDIILDPINKEILTNIIETGYFPNLLFYGPPGTGKTTTIINLVNAYQEKYNQKNKELMIHLNASDERGIDVIRNNINQFVNSKTLFNKGMKFVILDEVDYMTKNAQQALRYLLQEYSSSVRFCLICNYISRIDEGLQHEFLKLSFNQLPERDIISFLINISKSENLNFSEESLMLIQKLHKSDIRSMINFMQTNQDVNDNKLNIIEDKIWEELYEKIIDDSDLNELNNFIFNVSIEYNIDKKNIIKDFLNYLIRNNEKIMISEFFDFVENIIHFEDCKIEHYVNFAMIKLKPLLNNVL